MSRGWTCPNCGGCYSPATPQCFNCTGRYSTGSDCGRAPHLSHLSVPPENTMQIGDKLYKFNEDGSIAPRDQISED